MQTRLNALLPELGATLESLAEDERAALGPDMDARALLDRRSAVTDEILTRIWQTCLPDREDLALVAVGGYGRRELFPQSDIDLLILLQRDDVCDVGIHDFLHGLWDLKLHVGHSVRTLNECRNEGMADITVATNYMDARLLAGSRALFRQFRSGIRDESFWPPPAFLKAKLAEQQARHAKYEDTGFKIEPNVKESPGGLRDIQTVRWIAARLNGAASLAEMHEVGLLTDTEFRSLEANFQRLARIRIALHLSQQRPEERLLLAYQKELAGQFGYQSDEDGNLAVECFMQAYFRAVTETERLNGLLMQMFEERLAADGDTAPRVISPRFVVRNGFLETRDAQVFMRSPTALFEVFLLLARHPELRGVSAATIRQLRANLSVIDEGFRGNAMARRLFMEILQSPRGVFSALRRMNRFGVLAAYIPEFSAIVGRMQFDLYHLYTVDEHTLFVIRNLRRFSVPELADEHPLGHSVFQRIDQPCLLYLAALFHDIAKGRGGDHEELGAIDAEAFCSAHGLAPEDTALVAWLVREHLTMSFTAQRRDIDDPEVVTAFAQKVGSPRRLDYLYLLTMADIRATNPKLWTSWRDNLLCRLYRSTRDYFERGQQPIGQMLDETREETLALAREASLDMAALSGWLDSLPEEYFLRYYPSEILRHARLVLDPSDRRVEIQPDPQSHTTQLLVYSPLHPALFTQLAARVDQERLNVQGANLTIARNGWMLIEFFVLDRDGQPITDPWLLDSLRGRLMDAIDHPEVPLPPLKRRPARDLKPFSVPTEICFSRDEARARTCLQVTTKDRPGLLARLADALWRADVHLLHARISTLGERVEDAFFIVDESGRPVEDKDRQQRLRDMLLGSLDEDD
ncbi:MAG: [protein-PII] uridylyltransferase [Halothiobacillaceae bacterium]